jgi:hypothetical protein
MPEETAAYFKNGDPKFPFVGRIVEAYYTNPELTDVAIIHNYDIPNDDSHTDTRGNPSGGKEGTTVYNVTVSESDPRFLALLEEFSYESLDQCTRQKNESDRQTFRDAFHRYATENNLYGHGSDSSTNSEEKQGSLDLLFDFDPENMEHKETLFKLKLKMFEQKEVKSSKKRTPKTDIRKAETPIEAIKAYCKFF